MTPIRAASAASAWAVVVLLDYALKLAFNVDLPVEVEGAIATLLAGGAVAATWPTKKDPAP